MDFRFALFGFAAPESLLIGFSVRSLGTLSKLSVLSRFAATRRLRYQREGEREKWNFSFLCKNDFHRNRLKHEQFLEFSNS